MPSPARPGRPAIATVATLAAALGATIGPSAGCQRSLFVDKQPRTQFESYDQMRQRYVPVEEPDVFGNPQPALRARLTRSR